MASLLGPLSCPLLLDLPCGRQVRTMIQSRYISLLNRYPDDADQVLRSGPSQPRLNLDESSGTIISPKKLKRMLRSNDWSSYQMGKISRDEAMGRLSTEMGCSAEELRQFLEKKRASLVPITEVVQLLERLELNLYCMTNCPAEDAQELQKAFPDIFPRCKKIFTSSAAGMRKPNLNFFEHVLEETGIVPSETVFLDDDLANVIATESLGITSILVPSRCSAGVHAIAQAVKQVVSTLRTQEEQLSAAREYMLSHQGVYKSLELASGGLRVPVLFDHFIIADLLDDERYLPIEAPPEGKTINCFPAVELSVQNGCTGEELGFILQTARRCRHHLHWARCATQILESGFAADQHRARQDGKGASGSGWPLRSLLRPEAA